MILGISACFGAFSLFCLIIDMYLKELRKKILLVSCIILIIIVGFREPTVWPDTENYLYAFHYIPSLFEMSFSNNYVLEKYREEGFMLLSIIIKTFTSSGTIYLTTVSAITVLFLYKSLRRYCVYPLIGLIIYISRFLLGRDMMQIRSALAFLLLVFFIKDLKNGKRLKYLLVILLATSIHYASIIFVIPLILSRYKFTNCKIYIILIITIFATIFFSTIVVNYVLNIPEVSIIVRTSVFTDENSYGYSMGFSNPMIYYQLAVFVAYVMLEKKLSQIDPYYYTIRIIYLLGLFILVFLNIFAVLAGRLSTIFCTFEIIMIPSILYVLPSKVKIIASFGIVSFFSILFYLNYLTKLPS